MICNYLYIFPDGSSELLRETEQLVRNMDTMRRMQFASYIVNLDTGRVVKDRYENTYGTKCEAMKLHRLRVKHGLLPNNQFEDELFVL